MKKQGRKIVHLGIGIVLLLIILVALPSKWSLPIGMTEEQYNKKLAAVSDELLLATTKKERQAAAHKAQWLRKYSREGHIGEEKNMIWVLNTIRFAIITGILFIFWIIIKLFRDDHRKIPAAGEKAATGSADQA